MDKITLPELPLPDKFVQIPKNWAGILGGGVQLRAHSDTAMDDYARACCKHVLELAAQQVTNDFGRRGVAAAIRQLIQAL